jgi:hypothetical protein
MAALRAGPPRRLAAGLLLAAVTGLTVGCSGGPHATKPSPSPRASRLGPAPVAVHETLADPLLGDTVSVLALIHDFPAPAGSAAAGGSVVLVQVRAEVGDRLPLSIRGAAFTLLGAAGAVVGHEATASLAPAMAAAGDPPLPGDEVQAGQSGTGWLAFVVSGDPSGPLTLRYQRAAITVVGSGQVLPAVAPTAALPSAP